jgi:hypothetical protein
MARTLGITNHAHYQCMDTQLLLHDKTSKRKLFLEREHTLSQSRT